MRKRTFALLAAITLLTVAVAPAQDLKEAKKTFNKLCADCHGKDGRGQGPKALSSGFKPRDFSLGAFKCRCTPSGQLPTDDDLLRSILEGLPGSAMPEFPDLAPEEAVGLVDYIKSLSSRFHSEAQPPCLELPDPVPSTPELVNEGRQIYRIFSCASCHGSEGRGDGPSAKSLLDDWEEPIRVPNFVRTGKLKCGSEDVDLYRTLHTGLNGAPMPSYRDAFLFAGDSVPDPQSAGIASDESAISELRRYLEGQPDGQELSAMETAERQSLIERRTWALVSFVKSLISTD